MLKYLNITNFAVIQRLSFELHPGLNLLTGETGAGKSIIVDALGLLLGGRATSDLVRTGERAAVIEGQFDLAGAGGAGIAGILAEIGLDVSLEDGLLIRREVQASGRSRIFVNDYGVTGATLKRLQPFLVEIHGQGEQQALAASRTHLEMLDSFAGCTDLRQETGRAYARWRSAFEALRALERDEAARERASDMLRFQIAEIEKAAPRPSEDEELSAERRLLAHAERALELSTGAYAELYESDGSVLGQLASVRRRLQDLASIDARMASLLEGVETATVSLTDVAEALRGYDEGLDFSPSRLGEIEDRLAELERLKRKYGRDLAGLLEVKDELNAQLRLMGNLEERERELLEALESAAGVYRPLAERLTKKRREAAPGLERQVSEELSRVAMERARFQVALETAEPEPLENYLVAPSATGAVAGGSAGAEEKSQAGHTFWSPYGAERVEFLFSANVGENVRPLARVASGGELSRLMLTLRTVCRTASARSANGGAEAEETGGTLIFDEIDTGIGGRVAEVVGRRLRSLSANRQVLCVTHQPQIARFADYHYVVAKRVEDERTITSVRELSQEERVGELARMIGGAETIETARATARWMLEHLEEETEAAPKRARASKSAPEEPKMSARRPRHTEKGKGSRLARENSATLAGRK